MWAWIIGGLIVWMLVALLAAVVIGRGIRMADERTADTGVDLLPAVARPRRRGVPLPPLGIGLAAAAVALETVGYVGRLTGSTTRVLSMDAPYSLPRMFVAALFAAAALVALAGAARIPGRRTWWLAVGVVAAAIALVKAGSTVHATAMDELADAVGPGGAVGLSMVLAAAVIAVLGFLSRAERRDRRRVLGCFAGYAVAAVGLSAVSAVLDGRWGMAATFVEESGEALAGVALLVAVLIGVAPRLVLPADWALRREADAHTLEVPDRLPGTARG
ncbi:hypothetical protein [Geodermatophilus ruber]|uniref:Uncharacterized protein n=1 Tax=Geodermatophilus ruber TaxID=504800 RepID=A0A1I4DER7_9ACTN|nr:hypothetical protein [Geodermatophilus ruber]SFK91952.1 hypothetical protein SAMN04488085_104353 [Geodermatophilus ruber]